MCYFDDRLELNRRLLITSIAAFCRVPLQRHKTQYSTAQQRTPHHSTKIKSVTKKLHCTTTLLLKNQESCLQKIIFTVKKCKTHLIITEIASYNNAITK